MKEIHHCPMCNSEDVVEKDDKPSGIPIGTTYFICKACGHKGLMFPSGKGYKVKKWWEFWRSNKPPK